MKSKRILVDGRVFSTTGFNRGTGRYTAYLLSLLKEGGYDISLLLFKGLQFAKDESFLSRFDLRFSEDHPFFSFKNHLQNISDRSHLATRSLVSELVEAERYDLYIDTVTMLGPARFDNPPCPVIALCYDFILMRNPEFFLTSDDARLGHLNSLKRIAEANAVICISQQTHGETQKYLGVDPEKLFVIHPRIEDQYLGDISSAPTLERSYIFSIVGSIISKNPTGALSIFRQILDSREFSVRMNIPTKDQMEAIKANFDLPPSLEISCAIKDEEKYELQKNAKLIAHLSLEEGFGIPLLEALFLRKKIVALDIPVNREFLSKTVEPFAQCVFLISAQSTSVDLPSLKRFLSEQKNEEFYSSIRCAYLNHWKQAPLILERCISMAQQGFGSSR